MCPLPKRKAMMNAWALIGGGRGGRNTPLFSPKGRAWEMFPHLSSSETNCGHLARLITPLSLKNPYTNLVVKLINSDIKFRLSSRKSLKQLLRWPQRAT